MDEHTLLHTDPSSHDQGFKKQNLNLDKPWTAQSLRQWHYLIKAWLVLDLLSNATQIWIKYIKLNLFVKKTLLNVSLDYQPLFNLKFPNFSFTQIITL